MTDHLKVFALTLTLGKVISRRWLLKFKCISISFFFNLSCTVSLQSIIGESTILNEPTETARWLVLQKPWGIQFSDKVFLISSFLVVFLHHVWLFVLCSFAVVKLHLMQQDSHLSKNYIFIFSVYRIFLQSLGGSSRCFW